jgi:hypothetical protein
VDDMFLKLQNSHFEPLGRLGLCRDFAWLQPPRKM